MLKTKLQQRGGLSWTEFNKMWQFEAVVPRSKEKITV